MSQGRYSRRASSAALAITLILTGGCLIAEVVGGLLGGGLALLADVGHMLTDGGTGAGRNVSVGQHYAYALICTHNATPLWFAMAVAARMDSDRCCRCALPGRGGKEPAAA